LLLDFLHEHLQEVRSTHARSRADLPVQRLRELFRLTIEWENQIKLPSLLLVELPSRRQLVVIRNLNLFGSAALGLRWLLLVGVHVVESARAVALGAPEAAIFSTVLTLHFAAVLNALFAALGVEHLAQSALFDAQATIELVLLLQTRLSLLLICLDLLLSLGDHFWLFVEWLTPAVLARTTAQIAAESHGAARHMRR